MKPLGLGLRDLHFLHRRSIARLPATGITSGLGFLRREKTSRGFKCKRRPCPSFWTPRPSVPFKIPEPLPSNPKPSSAFPGFGIHRLVDGMQIWWARCWRRPCSILTRFASRHEPPMRLTRAMGLCACPVSMLIVAIPIVKSAPDTALHRSCANDSTGSSACSPV